MRISRRCWMLRNSRALGGGSRSVLSLLCSSAQAFGVCLGVVFSLIQSSLLASRLETPSGRSFISIWKSSLLNEVLADQFLIQVLGVRGGGSLNGRRCMMVARRLQEDDERCRLRLYPPLLSLVSAFFFLLCFVSSCDTMGMLGLIFLKEGTCSRNLEFFVFGFVFGKFFFRRSRS
jgi:hypothetical protein